MAFELRYPIRLQPLSKPSKRRSGLSMAPGVRFVVAHDTGNPGSTASGNVAFYERTRNDKSASAHLFVDDHEIVECIPALAQSPPEKAWHVLYSKPTDNQLFGFDANDAAIGIEYCYGGNIDADQAYARYVWVIAYACHKFGLDPARKIVGHYFLDPERKTDPVTGLAHSRRSFEQLQRDVVEVFRECGGVLAGGVSTAPAPAPAASKGGSVVVVTKLNLRSGQPNRRAPIARAALPGETLSFVAVVDGESINNNAHWYKQQDGAFFWSGGVREHE